MNIDHGLAARFFIGCIAPIDRIWPSQPLELLNDLSAHFGLIDQIWSPTANWDAPESYQATMGRNLGTVVFVFQHRCAPKDLVKAKAILLEIEDRFSLFGHRRFNLNPGFIDDRGMFLASHKPGPFRSRLADGVWLEQQMMRSANLLIPLSNVFTEYSEPSRLRLLNKLSLQKNTSVRFRESSPYLQFVPQDSAIPDDSEVGFAGEKSRPAKFFSSGFGWPPLSNGIFNTELLAFINNKDATLSNGKKDATLFRYLLSLAISDSNDRMDAIATVCNSVQSRVVSDCLLRDAIHELNAIHLTTIDKSHALRALDESILRDMRDTARDSSISLRFKLTDNGEHDCVDKLTTGSNRAHDWTRCRPSMNN